MYPSTLPPASVVICFFNEAFSALLRTVHSVLDRTPSYLLHEIILVDDHSELGKSWSCSYSWFWPRSCHLTPCCVSSDELKEDLDRYLKDHLDRKVRLVRNPRREGLIRGRMIGASHASGESRLCRPAAPPHTQR